MDGWWVDWMSESCVELSGGMYWTGIFFNGWNFFFRGDFLFLNGDLGV
jgi:hypothetical protein